MSRRAPIMDPLYTWHSATCEKCGDHLHVRADQLVPDAIMPGCCPVNGGGPHDRHVADDIAKRPLLCGSCGYEREFGVPPATPLEEEESEDKMARKKKGAEAPVAPADANGTNGTVRSEPSLRKVYEQNLPCKVGDEVNAAKALELASEVHKRGVWREDWKAQCAEARETRAAFDKRIEDLAGEVNGKVEYRKVEIKEFLMPDNSVQVIRTDTGEVLDTRTAEAEDLQEPMFTGREDAEPVEPKAGDIEDPSAILKAPDPGSAEALFGE